MGTNARSARRAARTKGQKARQAMGAKAVRRVPKPDNDKSGGK